MKKITALMLTFILCISVFAGCGKNYATEASTVFVLKNGKIVSTDVEEFEETYDKSELETYISNIIKEYSDEHGKDSVKLNKLIVEEGKATLIMEYASAEDYMNFNGVEIFEGTVVDALAAGYAFDVDFASISDLKATACSKDEIIENSDLKVVIYKGTGNVNVNGTIVYASVVDTQMVDNGTIAIANGNNLLGQAAEAVTSEASETSETNETEAVEETTEFEDDMGSVSEDDLLAESAEEESVQFDFGDEEVTDNSQSYSNAYTYIIYK